MSTRRSFWIQHPGRISSKVMGSRSMFSKPLAADSLRDRGATVAATGWIASREDADAAMDAADAAHGPFDVVVHALVQREALVPTPFLDLDEPAWERVAEDPISATLFVLQAAYD